MIGIDAVDIERLRVVMDRSKRTQARLFTRAERNYCEGRGDPVRHYAGTLAAKEAVIKAAGLGSLAAWGRRIEVRRDSQGAPEVRVRGIRHSRFDLSISHDGSVAVAVAVAHRACIEETSLLSDDSSGKPVRLQPNQQLMRYIGGPACRAWTPTARNYEVDANKRFPPSSLGE